MKLAIGLLLIIGGIFVGLYFGIWWAFIGGIITVIQQIKAEHMSAGILAIGIAKIVFATAIGWFSALALIIPGVGVIASVK